MFGSQKSSLMYLEENLPATFSGMKEEEDEWDRLKDESAYLDEELNRERAANKELQQDIIGKRKRYDEICSTMSLLRGETEAVLTRHNIMLDTAEARAAAQQIHDKETEEKDQQEGAGEDGVDETVVDDEALDDGDDTNGRKRPDHSEEHENDGDDEGEEEEDEDEDDGGPPAEVVVKNANVDEEDI